ncbi:hypothetical protein MMC21_001691 [Puttea exsequens]|nr:hypothetical protein [Puttea exsequens]
MSNFDITTAIRSDGVLLRLEDPSSYQKNAGVRQFYMLDKHQYRMLAALTAFEWPQLLSDKISVLEQYLARHLEIEYGSSHYKSPLKIRVALSSNGEVAVTSSAVPELRSDSLFPHSLFDLTPPSSLNVPATYQVFVSSMVTQPDQFTVHKTSQRVAYDKVRALLPTDASSPEVEVLLAEILLVNVESEVMEGSITTPYFLRDGRWVTPASRCGGNLGTTRRFALEQALAQEAVITKSSLKLGEEVILSNGVRGFGWGVIISIL